MLADDYYLMTTKDGKKQPVETITVQGSDGVGYRFVRGYKLNWSLDHLIGDGDTFTPLIPLPNADIREALHDACVQRKHDIYNACGCSTSELAKAERLVERYDAALAWLDSFAKERGDGE